MEEPWSALSDRSFVAMVEQLFSHLLKVLNICAHVLDDTPPGPPVKVTELFSSCQRTIPRSDEYSSKGENLLDRWEMQLKK